MFIIKFPGNNLTADQHEAIYIHQCVNKCISKFSSHNQVLYFKCLQVTAIELYSLMDSTSIKLPA